MTYQTLLFEIKDGIAFVTINRPDKLNALNDQVMLELGSAVDRITTEAEIKGAILTGAGPKSRSAACDSAMPFARRLAAGDRVKRRMLRPKARKPPETRSPASEPRCSIERTCSTNWLEMRSARDLFPFCREW